MIEAKTTEIKMTEAKTTEAKRPTINWMDVLWLVLLALLAVLPPVREYHKQLILLAFGILQLNEGCVAMPILFC